MALYQRLKRQFFSRVWLIRGFLVLLLFAGSLALWQLAVKPLASKAFPLWQAFSFRLPLHAGRTNFLLLGVPGGSHAGADLTDTLIFLSLGHTTGDVLLLSIPRDLWIPSLRAKINTAYHYGEAKQPGGGGLTLAKAAVSEILNQPVHYAAVINFTGFEKFIDALGGVDIIVDRPFIDRRFPIPGREDDLCDGDPEYGCRYETIEFASGIQRMTGSTALKFIRSRNAEGDEGTDFARSARQEKLVLAIKAGLFSQKPSQIRGLIASLSPSVITDITPQSYWALFKLGLKSARSDIRTAAVSEPDQVYHPPVTAAQDFQWVLLPKDNDPRTLFSYVENLLSVPVQK